MINNCWINVLRMAVCLYSWVRITLLFTGCLPTLDIMKSKLREPARIYYLTCNAICIATSQLLLNASERPHQELMSTLEILMNKLPWQPLPYKRALKQIKKQKKYIRRSQFECPSAGLIRRRSTCVYTIRLIWHHIVYQHHTHTQTQTPHHCDVRYRKLIW